MCCIKKHGVPKAGNAEAETNRKNNNKQTKKKAKETEGRKASFFYVEKKKNDSNFVRKKGIHSKNNAFRRLLQAGRFQKGSGPGLGKAAVLCSEEVFFPVSVFILNFDICSCQAGNISSPEIRCGGKFIKTT